MAIDFDSLGQNKQNRIIAAFDDKFKGWNDNEDNSISKNFDLVIMKHFLKPRVKSFERKVARKQADDSVSDF